MCLPPAKPLRRRWRTAGNNGILRKHLVLYCKPRPIDGTNPPRPQRRRGGSQPRPSRPAVPYVQEHLPWQMFSFCVRRETLGGRLKSGLATFQCPFLPKNFRARNSRIFLGQSTRSRKITGTSTSFRCCFSSHTLKRRSERKP